MRSKEHIKTVILALLVLMSLVLTYMTWKFTPDLQTVEKQDNSKESSSQAIGKVNSARMNEVVTPYQIIHSKKDHPEGMAAKRKNVKRVLAPIENQRVTHSDRMHSEHNLIIPDLSSEFLVLDFTYDMPLATYLGDVLNISAKVPTHFKFNRLIIDESQDKKIQLYAISKNRHDVVRMTLSSKTSKVNQTVKSLHKDMEPYVEMITNKDTIDSATHIFAPKSPKNLKSYRTIYNHINVDKMNNVLFNDSVVVRSAKNGATTYNNNTGVANYDNKTEKYKYNNLSEDKATSKNMHETIPGTFDYINEHGGFTDDFRLFHSDNKTGQLTYQMFLNGRPTFNRDNLNSINVSWSDGGIYSYECALLKSNVTIDSGEKQSKLPGAEKVRASLANNPDINFEKVSNITIGYKRVDQPDKDDIEVQRNSEFTPQWYIEYDGKWYAYDNDGGLE
ncbi:two-component system activity regulator YycH [Staphylococcus sp. SQ8-PEA]|uniref:Two-component system activity regulator YycH n=1 Tax=Staphylococcus marylandisciuri TaxID=2981529 RepID=A0ABT2QT20_9STAP|nr:two-component system activity regulator YycH [Staphylococcus marylandisciuri]MCU5747098.1 two-component system activity regulator YycH [Staphylococcus marylandisciuri]